MKDVFEKIDSMEPELKIEGDIVEFATWKGVGLIYFARLLSRNPNNLHLAGIDSFQGLLHDSSKGKKGTFTVAELNFDADNILKNTSDNFKKILLHQLKDGFLIP